MKEPDPGYQKWGLWLRVRVEKVIWLTVVRILRQPEFTT